MAEYFPYRKILAASFFKLYIYFILWLFWVYLVAASGLLIAAASLVAEHGL